MDTPHNASISGSTFLTATDQLPAVSGVAERTDAIRGRGNRGITLAGVPIDNIDFRGAVHAIVDHAIAGGESGYVVTPNAHHVVLHQRESLLREVYRHALLVVTDGVPLLWAARALGQPLRGRVNGTDLFEELCAEASRRELRVYFLGGRPGAAAAAADRLRERHPSLVVCGTSCPPFGFERDVVEDAKIIADINAKRPHLLFVGLGAPKQEYWMYTNRERLNVPVMLGIGASFDFVAGMLPRAPLWMQRNGLEWLYRLASEPERLWKRYFIGNVMFCGLIAREFLLRLTAR